MTTQGGKSRLPLLAKAPKELLGIGGFTLGVFFVVLTGSLLAERFDGHSPWVFAASYAVPSGIAFTIYWLISRRL